MTPIAGTDEEAAPLGVDAAAEASREQPLGVRPWFHRVILESRLTPIGASLAGGCAWTAIIGIVWVTLVHASSAPMQPSAELVRYGIRTSLIVALMLWASPYLSNNLDRTIASLAPHMTLSAHEIAWRRNQSTHYRRGILFAAGCVGVLFCGIAAELSYRGLEALARGDLGPSDTAILLTRLPLFFLIGQVMYIIFALILRMRTIGAENLEVRLFALRRLEPFARMGLSLALLLAIAGTLVVVTSISWAGPGAEMSFNLFNVVPLMASAVLAAAIPFLALRRRIVEEKRLELERIDRALEGDPEGLRGSPMRAQIEKLELPALLAYQRQVEDVSNWPFFRTVSRSLALYVLIPFTGWIAAALVEIALERVL